MSADEKIDLYELHKDDYIAPKYPMLLTVKPATYLSISGQGEPGGTDFIDNVAALYSVALTIKMTRKFAGQGDYAICKLEAQWHGPNDTYLHAWPQDKWCWKLLIRTPDFVTPADLSQAVATLDKAGKAPASHAVHIESLDEGLCVQMLHLGPYQHEPETVALMEAYARGQSLHLNGRHHEIYLSDPRRVAQPNLRTILRIPVRKA